MKESLVIIPARAGSKGVPNKNRKLLGGIPLIGHTVLQALEVFDKEQICISTDDLEIIKYVELIGIQVHFDRPSFLSDDKASTYDVIIHAMDFYRNRGFNPKNIVLLQPTSPFRNAKHIREALALYDDNLEMIVSVSQTKANPYFVLFEEDEFGYLQKSKNGNFNSRQEAPKVWEYNGAIYVINPNALRLRKLNEFKKVKKYVMDEVSSHDIDTMLDWLIAEAIIERAILKH